jgi:FtsZ-binding cell division protein ZapB
VEPIGFVETMRSIRMEVQSYRDKNEKMMREQNQLNPQMTQILNQFQRKVKNGLGSRHEEDVGSCFH